MRSERSRSACISRLRWLFEGGASSKAASSRASESLKSSIARDHGRRRKGAVYRIVEPGGVMAEKQGAALSAERLGVDGAGRAALAERAALLLARAKARGATAAEVSLAKRQNLELTVRQGALET